MSIRFIAALIALSLFGTGCVSGRQGAMTPTAAPPRMTSTLRATLVATLSKSPLPSASPVASTLVPVDGVTTTQVNVRAEPSTAGLVLGMIPASTRVEITGKDPGGNWWQINYPHPDAPNGKGWVTSQYVTAPTTPEIPTIGEGEAGPNHGNVAVIQQPLNVRSGPGTGFNSLGTLHPQDVVNLTGKDRNGAWLQIDFPSGPEGKGWVNAAFVRAQGVEDLPIIAESGQVVGTGTPIPIPFTPTPTIVPAPQDGDSAEGPIASVILEPAGVHSFIYSGELSAPVGDSDDWIEFKPYDRFVLARLECNGKDALETQVLENGLPVDMHIPCGSPMERLPVRAGANYVIHLRIVSAAEILQYASYTLTIKTRP